MPLSEELEDRLDRFNGPSTVFFECLTTILKHSNTETRNDVIEAMDSIIESQDDSPAAQAARTVAEGIKRDLTRKPILPSK